MADQKAGGWATPYKYTGKELDTDIGMYDYGARFYDPSISLWTSVDPLTAEMPSWSPYNYTFNNPVKYVDPDGKAPVDHIFYLVFKKGTKVNMDNIAQKTQEVLNNNDINLTVQVLEVDDWDSDNNVLLDDTDRLSVIGDNGFVGNALDENENYMTKKKLAGLHGYGVGHVSTDQVEMALKRYGGKDFEGHIVRSAIHEGIGHHGINGSGHPDLMEHMDAKKRYAEYNPNPNIMTSGDDTKLWSRKASDNGGCMFLPGDIKNIKKGIPDASYNGSEWKNCPNDNFSSKIKD